MEKKKVFVSWSGKRAKAMGAAVKKMLVGINHTIDPWFSPQDIGKGSLSMAEVFAALEDRSYGIICHTSDRAGSPWPMFEAGALAKNLTSDDETRVVVVTLDVEPHDAEGPLRELQGMHALDQDGWLDVISDLNAKSPAPLDHEMLSERFDTEWSKYREVIEKIPSPSETVSTPDDEARLEEIVVLLRRLDRRVEALEHIRPARSRAGRELLVPVSTEIRPGYVTMWTEDGRTIHIPEHQVDSSALMPLDREMPDNERGIHVDALPADARFPNAPSGATEFIAHIAPSGQFVYEPIVDLPEGSVPPEAE